MPTRLMVALVAGALLQVGAAAGLLYLSLRLLPGGRKPLWVGALAYAASGLLVVGPLVAWATREASVLGGLFRLPMLPLLLVAAVTVVVELAARWLGLRALGPGRRSWRAGALFGAGYAATQAAFVGALPALATLGDAWVLPQLSASALGLSYREAVALRAAQAQLVTMDWRMPLLASLETAVFFVLQVALAVLVVEGLLRVRRRWLLAAGVLHLVAQAALLLGDGLGVPGWGGLGLLAATVGAGALAWHLRPRAQRISLR